MFHHHRTLVTLVLHGLININTGFSILSFFKKYPRICVEISSVCRLSLDSAITHFLRFIQVLAFYRQIISIIIESTDIILFINQSRIISSVCLDIHFLDMIQISHNGIEI